MGDTHRIWGAHQGAVAGMAVGGLWGPMYSASGALLWSCLGYAFATVPDRMERPLGVSHRGVTHWPEPPLIIGLLALALASGPFGFIGWIVGMSIAGIACSLLSHWTGDFMFGKAHTKDNADGSYTVIRPRGVPYLFGTKYKGIGFKVNSKGEKNFRRFLKLALPLNIIVSLYFALGG